MTDPTSQFEMFEGFTPAGTRAPKLALPIQRSNEIDVARACKILGVTPRTMRRMLERKLIRAYRGIGQGGPWRIDYDSVVDYCDRLRIDHCISDARVGLSGSRKRHRDSELLPFPLAHTISVADVESRLECSYTAVIHLIETGHLTGYQVLFETPGCPWRIFAPSVESYIASLYTRAEKRPSSRPAPPSR